MTITPARGGNAQTALLAHPFELAFALLFLIVGAGLAARGHQIRLSTVQSLPVPLVIGWEVCLILAGPAMAAGLLWRGTPQMGRALERAGLYLAAAAWGTYALTLGLLLHSHLVLLPIAQSATLAAACILRALALSRVDRIVERETR